MTKTMTKTCECGATIERKPGSRGPLPKRCDSCKASTRRTTKTKSDRRSRSRARAERYSRPSRICGQWRSPWELIRAGLGWPTNVPAWALKDAGHNPSWYDERRWPREVVLARKYGHPMPEGYDETDRYPGEERRLVHPAWSRQRTGRLVRPARPVWVGGSDAVEPDETGDHEPALPGPGREERSVLREVDDALSGDERAPETDPATVALPDDVAALRITEEAPAPIERQEDVTTNRVDLSKAGGYVDRRSSRKRDLSALARYATRYGPDGLSEEDAAAAREWLETHGEQIPRGL